MLWVNCLLLCALQTNGNVIFQGIFPGRCYPIAAREITREELKMVSVTYFQIGLLEGLYACRAY